MYTIYFAPLIVRTLVLSLLAEDQPARGWGRADKKLEMAAMTFLNFVFIKYKMLMMKENKHFLFKADKHER